MFISNLWESFKKSSYYYFLGIATAYAIFYGLYLLTPSIYTSLKCYDKIIDYGSSISILFFTAGIFSASLKYMQYLGLFEAEFAKVINSKSFDDKLKQSLRQITFSEEFLLEQSDLSSIWETVTLCKYNKQFKDLYPKLRSQLKNELFADNNISYYLKNYIINYRIKKIDKEYVEIEEKSSFTLVAANKESVRYEMGYETLKDESNKTNVDLHFEVTNNTNIIFDEKDIKISEDIGTVTKSLEKEFSGSTEYHVEKKINVSQNINKDRIFIFSASRIIDNLMVNIEHSQELDVFFTTVNGTELKHHGAYDDTRKAYICRDVLLPGDKYVIFIYRVGSESNLQEEQ